jgi:hypothetical protein
MNMINLLILLIVFCIVAGLIYYLLTLLPLPQPFKNVIMIAFILILILVLLGFVFGGINVPIVVGYMQTLPMAA